MKAIKDYSDIEKRFVILNNKKFKYEIMKGYCFPSPVDGDHDYHFVSLEDAKPIIDAGEQDYFMEEHGEEIYDLQDAWDYFIDYWYDEFETDKEAEEELEKIRKLNTPKEE